ncbi:hypothetical protein [Desulfurobacterium atlanticum]|uniref:FlgN protein n=1 Tax=Desulfurobacterium atlanticum TaxID=240169 RepID=A0A238YH15_9BACT|nr:hypothetical protein [Desulfurobacterium atlanticum]SNR70088.1 hypothetical protein SAMN06265340_103123 [Desulfurobacterium atlanticum]
MNIEKEIDLLLNLVKEENTLLKKGISSNDTADKLLEINEKKRKLLSRLATLEAKDLEPFKNKLKEIEEINSRNQILLINNMDILEETIKSLIPEEYINTYSSNGKIKGTSSIFGKKV